MGFQLIVINDVVRVPPSSFGKPLAEVASSILKAKYESTLNPEYGYIIYITKVNPEKVGKIIPGDGATYHKVELTALTFYPNIQEVVEGEVVEITDFGAFIRIGPVDALLHLSQITDDYLTSDVKQGLIVASQSRRVLKVGSRVRARISAVSLSRGAAMGKIGVTCRQPFLGAFEWIEEDIAKAKAAKTVEAKPTASRKAS